MLQLLQTFATNSSLPKASQRKHHVNSGRAQSKKVARSHKELLLCCGKLWQPCQWSINTRCGSIKVHQYLATSLQRQGTDLCMLLSCTLDSPASRNFDSWSWKIWSIQAKIQHVLSVQHCGDFVAVPEVDWLCKPSKGEFHGTLGSQLVLMKLHTCTLTDKISTQVASSSLELSGCRQSAFSEIPTCMSKRRVKIERGDCADTEGVKQSHTVTAQ